MATTVFSPVVKHWTIMTCICPKFVIGEMFGLHIPLPEREISVHFPKTEIQSYTGKQDLVCYQDMNTL